MVSQLLFGERVEVTSRVSGWVRVRTMQQDCEGWIEIAQLETCDGPVPKETCIAGEISEAVFADDRSTFVTLGASLPHYDGITARIHRRKYRYSGQVFYPKRVRPSFALIERVSRKLLNTPYLTGGRSPFGLDASAFVQLVYRCCGYELPRFVQAQMEHGDIVDFTPQAQPGDLAFFEKEDQGVAHVGIICGPNQVIHCHDFVRVDSFDQHGVYDKRRRRYTHRLRVIKRIITPSEEE